MQQYAADRLIHITARLADLKENAVHHRGRQNFWPDVERKKLQSQLREALPWLDDLSLNATKVLWEQLARDLDHLGIEAAMGKADLVRTALEADLKARVFFVVHYDNVRFLNHPAPAGEKVKDKWGAAHQELVEAGNCFALTRYKSSVFHCCLAYEAGLKALAQRLRVRKQNNWGAYITAIRTELSKRYSPRANRDRQFYAECANRLDAIRIGRRNPVSHFGFDAPYTEQEAREILEASFAFLRHLATRLAK